MRTTPLATTLIYLAVGALWISLSDLVVLRVAGGPDAVTSFQTFKGWGFVIVTGAVLYLLLRRRDTAVRRSRAELREREAFYHGLIDNASDTMLVLAADGTVEYASPSVYRHTGYRPEAFVERNALEVIHPEDLPRVQTAFARALRHPGETVAADYRIRHANGNWRHVSSVGRMLPGEPPRMVVNTRDLTENRVIEEQFRQAQKFEAIGQLTAGIVHDFNNVLSVVMSNAELLLSELPAQLAEQRADAEHIKQAAQGGADMVRKLLGFSRQAALRIAPVDLGLLLEDVRTMLRRILPPTIAVRVGVREAAPPVLADAGAVQQIVLNLATNARDAMDGEGSLSIEVAEAHVSHEYLATHPWAVPGDYVTITVTDTGSGMDAATKARIFEPFFTTKPPGKGTGLGMPMIFGLVKQHGGMVDVDSEPGRGTRVTVLLPAAPAGSRTAPRRAQAPVRGGEETILLVDDEEALRRTGKRILEKFGYSVDVARDGAEGLAVLERRAGEVDLVISDVQMPNLTGIQLYHELERRGWAGGFLFSSGEAAGEFRDHHGLDTVGFVQKPWTVEEMARAVRAALDASMAC